jgi:hypothetical protein
VNGFINVVLSVEIKGKQPYNKNKAGELAFLLLTEFYFS